MEKKKAYLETQAVRHSSCTEISFLSSRMLGGKNQHANTGAPVLSGMSLVSGSAFYKDIKNCGEKCIDDRWALPTKWDGGRELGQ